MNSIEKDLAQMTLHLCSIASATGHESMLADEIERTCKTLVLERDVRRLGNCVIARGPMQKSRPTIALLGHLDTVLPAKNQPLRLDITEGLVYGLGASDMKGGLAVMLALLKESTSLLGANLVLVFYDKEEGPDADNGLGPLLFSGLLQGIDLAICLEPTDNQVQAGCLGGLHATVTFFGKQAHSARPWQGKNAIYEALSYLKRLESFGKKAVDVQGLVFYEVMNATQIKAGGSRNVIPGECSLNVNYRFSPATSIEQATLDLIAMVPLEAQVDIIDQAPSGKVCLDHPLVQDFVQSQRLDVVAKQAFTDVGRLTKHGIPAINFGPGQTAKAHQENESVPIQHLQCAYHALKQWLQPPWPGQNRE